MKDANVNRLLLKENDGIYLWLQRPARTSRGTTSSLGREGGEALQAAIAENESSMAAASAWACPPSSVGTARSRNSMRYRKPKSPTSPGRGRRSWSIRHPNRASERPPIAMGRMAAAATFG